MSEIKRKINKKRSAIIVISVSLVVIACFAYAMILKGNNTNANNEQDNNVDVYQEPVEQKEVKVKDKTAQKIYDKLPKIYEEVVAPFEEEFKLKTAMQYISINNINGADFSEENVNEVVLQIFGINEALDKQALTESDDGYSLYYYSETEGKYVVRAFGMEFVYNEQVLKEVLEDDNAYYVYVYNIVGEYIPDDTKNKLYLIIGDKDGKDIVEEYEANDFNTDATAIVTEHKDKLPIYKYTLTKSKTDQTYYLTEVEQINY